MALNLGDVIVRLGLDTGQFTREMRAAQRQLQGAASGFRQAGQAASMAITLPLMAAGALALKFASEFDASMTQSMAIMSEFGSRSELMEQGQVALRAEMETTARTIAKDLNLAASDAAKSYFFLTSAGMDAQQSMAALPQVARFAKAGMFDFATATDLATDAQSALGLKSDDVAENLAGLTRVTDVLVAANQLANASTEQFAIALTTKAGAALKVANKSIEEGVAVLAAFADQGVKAQNAGTALQIVLRDLSTKALKNKEAFKQAGVAVFDAEGNYNNMADIVGDLENTLEGMSDAQKKATLLQLGFTDKSVIYLQTLLGTSDAMREHQARLESMGGAAKEVAENQLKAFNEQIGLVQKRVVDAAISVGSKLMPIILDFVVVMEPLIVLLESAAEWFAGWPKPLQLAAVAVAGMAAAMGPLLMTIGFLGQGVASLIAVWPALVTAFTFMTAKAIPALIFGFKGLAFHITSTVVPAIVSFATTLASLLLPALAVVATAIAAYKLTEWAMEWTGLRKAADWYYASMLKIVGITDEIPKSAQEINILTRASALAGEEVTDWSRAMEIVNAELMEARERMERYAAKMATATKETEKTAAASRSGADALDMFADAMGITRGKLDLVAKRLGMTTKEMFDNAEASKLVADELKKIATEAEATEKRLRDMVKTVVEAEREARDLARAVELEGGAMALTREETLRLAAMIKVWRGENIDVAKSLEEVVKRAEALATVENVLNEEMEITSVRGEQTVATLDEMAEQHRKNVEEVKEHNAYLEIYADDLRLAGEENEETAAKMEDTEKTFANYGQVIMEVAAIFEVFGISAESGIGRAIAAIAGLVATIPAILDFEQSILGSAASMSEKFAAGATAVAGGIAGIGAATAAGTTGQRVAGGAMAGAAAGGQIGGPIGAGIGAGVGALVGLFRGRAMDAAMRQIEQAVGMKVSEALANGIRDAAKALDISVMAAAALSLGAVWAEAGGVAAVGLEPAKLALQTLIDLTVRGEVPLSEGIASIGQAFGMMAEAAVEAGGVASSELFEVMEAAKRLGEEVPEIAAFIAASVEQAVAGVAAMGGIQIVTAEDAQAQATIFSTTFFAAIEEMGLRAAVEALGPAFDALKESMSAFGEVDLGGVERFFEIARDPQFGPLLDGIQGLTETLAGAANAGFLTTEMFNAIQHQGLSAFEQLTAAGLTEQEALQQMAPLLQNMIDASNQYGTALDPATAALIEQAEAAGIAFSADPMYVMIDAMTLVATLLGATEEQLASIGQTAEGTGENMAEMAASGQGAAEEIATAAGESTRTIEESYADMVQVVGGQFEMMGEVALGEMDIIASVAGTVAGDVLMIGEAAASSADDFDEMADAAEAAGVAVGDIPGPPAGGGATPMQHGGLVTKPTLALLGEEGPELVIPVSDLNQAAGPGAAGSGDVGVGGQAPTMNFDFSGAVVGDPNRLSQMIGEAVGIAIRNNEGDALTNVKEGLDTRA